MTPRAAASTRKMTQVERQRGMHRRKDNTGDAPAAASTRKKRAKKGKRESACRAACRPCRAACRPCRAACRPTWRMPRTACRIAHRAPCQAT
eukprot:362537-Chlamydomonas_euryale.AAC.2